MIQIADREFEPVLRHSVEKQIVFRGLDQLRANFDSSYVGGACPDGGQTPSSVMAGKVKNARVLEGMAVGFYDRFVSG